MTTPQFLIDAARRIQQQGPQAPLPFVQQSPQRVSLPPPPTSAPFPVLSAPPINFNQPAPQQSQTDLFAQSQGITAPTPQLLGIPPSVQIQPPPQVTPPQPQPAPPPTTFQPSRQDVLLQGITRLQQQIAGQEAALAQAPPALQSRILQGIDLLRRQLQGQQALLPQQLQQPTGLPALQPISQPPVPAGQAVPAAPASPPAGVALPSAGGGQPSPAAVAPEDPLERIRQSIFSNFPGLGNLGFTIPENATFGERTPLRNFFPGQGLPNLGDVFQAGPDAGQLVGAVGEATGTTAGEQQRQFGSVTPQTAGQLGPQVLRRRATGRF